MPETQKRKFFKTVIQIEILSEDAPVPDDMELADIAHEIVDGDWSGARTAVETKELTGAEAAKALIDQGSDPAFFNLSDSGEDIDA